MNTTFNDERLAFIRFMNTEHIPYLVDDTFQYKHGQTPPKGEPDTIFIEYDSPRSLNDLKLYAKLKPFYRALKNANTRVAQPFGMDFDKAFHERVIINHQGLSINFKHSEEIALEACKKDRIFLDLDYFTSEYGLYPNRRDIADLNRHNVRYLIIDQYPIEEAFGDKYQSPEFMVIWFDPEIENAKLVRKANKVITGNPPSLPSITKGNRLFLQGKTYWRNYYKNLDFMEAYNRRCIINSDGQEIPFLAQDDI